jgi:phosphoenolpyruvate---glycerone phosphotransferase subunit DhaL
MTTAIGYREFIAMIRGAIEKVKGQQKVLTELDSACGDGDHGTTMARAMDHLEKVIAENKSEDLQNLLQSMGWEMLGIDGGASGPLLGTFFLGMADSAAGKQTLDREALAQMFEASVAAVKKQTKALVGDKTMLDSLEPAVLAIKKGAEAHEDTLDLLRNAAEAAGRGAQSTKELKARFGRAKYLGERTLGHQDPGATSVSLMFQGFYEGLRSCSVSDVRNDSSCS